MASKFEILLQARLDKTNSDAQIRQDVKSLEKNLSLNLDLKADSKSATQIKNALSSVGDAAKKAQEHTQGLGDIVSKFSSWQVVGDIIHGVKNAIVDMVDQVFELDASLTELDKVTDLTSSGLQSLADDAFSVGQQIGATGKDVIDATTIFAQAGYEAQEALDLGEQAIMLKNVSEAGATAADSASTLIAAMKAFNLEAEDSDHIVDALNEVSNKYAVSVNDLSTAISKSSASMAAGNNSLEETFGLVTAGVEILREPGRVANGLSTITARLTAKNDEYIKSITKGQGVIDEQTGELRSTFDILQDLSEAWDTLSSVEQQELAEVVAGKTQRSLFTAIMTNFESAVGATEAALNSEGSAAAENAKRMDSLQGKVNQLQSAWQNFARNTINSEVVKSLITLSTNLIKLADTDIGRFILVLGVAKASMVAFNKVLGTQTVINLANAFKQQLITAITAVTVSFKAGALGATAFSGVLAALGTTIKAIGAALISNPIFLAISAIGILTTVISKANEEAAKARETAQELSDKYEEEANKGEELVKTYEELSSKKNLTKEETENLSKAVEELNKMYGISKEELNAEGKERDKTIEKIKKEIEERKKSAALNAEAAIEWKKLGFLGMGGSERDTFTARTPVSVDDGLAKKYDLEAKTVSDLKKKTEEYINTLQNKSEKTKEEEKDLEKLMSIYNKVSESVEDVSEGYNLAYENLKDGIPITTEEANVLYQLGDITEKDAQLIQIYNERIASRNDISDEQKEKMYEVIEAEFEFSDALAESEEGLYAHADATKALTEEQKQMQDNLTYTKEKLEEINDEIDSVQSAYGILTDAVNEYNSSGGITMDTLQQLLALDGEYLNALELVDGKLQISKSVQDQHAQGVRTDTLALIENAAMEDLMAMSTETAGNVASAAGSKIYSAGEDGKKAGDFAREGASGFLELATAMSKAGMVDLNTVDVDGWANKWAGITDKINNLTSSAGKGLTSSNFTGSSSSSGGSGGSSKKSSSSDTYKAEIDELYKYKNALDNAEDAVDRLNDALKNTDNFNEQEKILKQLIKATNKEIDATEDLKDAQVDQINDYISQLKKYGFQINYNSKTNELYIKNMDRLGKYTGDTAKKLEEMIEEIQDLNDDNRDLDSSIRDLTGDIQDFNEQLDELPTEKLEKFHDLLEEFQQSRLDQIQNEIDDIQHEMDNDPRLQALEEQIEALEKQNDELDNQKDLEEKLLAVEEAKIKLQNAQKQKNIQVYREGQGFVWEADPDAIADAQEELEQAQEDLNDKLKDDQLQALEDEKEAIEKSYQDRIDALEDFLDEQEYLIDKANREGIQSFDELREALEKYGLDSEEYLGQATEWLNNYNKELDKLRENLDDLGVSGGLQDGLIYSSGMQDRIDAALSNTPEVDTSLLTSRAINANTVGATQNSTIYINSIELPNVQNANDFVEALKDLPRLASSQSTLRT